MIKIFGLLVLTVLFFHDTVLADMRWEQALNGAHRSEANIKRDVYRHPKETLEFFGLEADHVVLEVSPGGGWYTEILAPLIDEEGTLIAAHSPVNSSGYGRRSLGAYLQMLGKSPELYGDVRVSALSAPTHIAPAELRSVDLALVFRNVHSWMRAGNALETLETIYGVLKPGGILGIVQHRAKAGTNVASMKNTAYVTEAHVIKLVEAAGFKLEASSEVNANPLDTKDHPRGVWTLPPTYAAGDQNRRKYQAIGESDRMTLRFRKPAP